MGDQTIDDESMLLDWAVLGPDNCGGPVLLRLHDLAQHGLPVLPGQLVSALLLRKEERAIQNEQEVSGPGLLARFTVF